MSGIVGWSWEWELTKADYRIDAMIQRRVAEERVAAAKRLETVHRSMGARWGWLARSIREELAK